MANDDEPKILTRDEVLAMLSKKAAAESVTAMVCWSGRYVFTVTTKTIRLLTSLIDFSTTSGSELAASRPNATPPRAPRPAPISESAQCVRAPDRFTTSRGSAKQT